jgi:para-aminobenzoate synthetase/4-amino-4-deoxychorismate lyase
VFLEFDAALYTPPLSCGLLDGVMRQHLLADARRVEERILYPEDLARAEAIYVSNAVRGLTRVTLCG